MKAARWTGVAHEDVQERQHSETGDEMNKKRCTKVVFVGMWGGLHPSRCSRAAWQDGFCKQHHPDTKQKNSPLHQLRVATARIAELESALKRQTKECERLREIINTHWAAKRGAR